MARKLWCGLAVALIAVSGGCGGSDGHPDTGYGANQPVPATEDCVDLCERLTNCGVELCDEDTNSTAYEALEPGLLDECEVTCTDVQVQSISTANWQCLFQDTCRQVFGESACGSQGHYSCNSG